MPQPLSLPAARLLIEQHLHQKPEDFALHYKGKDFPVAMLATQLKYLQKSKNKLPSFYEVRAIIPPLAYEQCSSEQAARLKPIQGSRILDLSCGLGVDSLYFAKQAAEVVAVEKNEELCEINRYNFGLMGIGNVEFVAGSAESFLENYQGAPFDWVYIDPSRRNEQGGRLFLPQDLSPNVWELLPRIQEVGANLWVKFSPLYDIQAAQKDFPGLHELFIISIENEVKELGLVFRFRETAAQETPLHILSRNAQTKQNFVFAQQPSQLKKWAGESVAFVYEPDSAFYKARCCQALFQLYYAEKEVFASGGEQGFFLSNEPIPTFAGRTFRLLSDFFPYQPKKILALLKEQNISQIHILQRNFPYSAALIRQSLKCKEGGTVFLVCTYREGKAVCALAERD